MGACEYLLILALMSSGGGASLISGCHVTKEECEQGLKDLISPNGKPTEASYIAQCVGVGELVDEGRE